MAKIKNENTPPAPRGDNSSYTLADKTLARIKELKLKPTPEIYELWFCYFQGDPQITKAIDDHEGTLDEDTCLNFYKNYSGHEVKENAVKKISDQVQTSITELAKTIGSVQTATSDYGDTLNNVTEKIEGAETLEELTAFVAGVIEDTKEMIKKNQELEIQLNTSSNTVNELKKNLDNVKKEALTDGLTGIANRKAFDRKIEKWIKEVQAKENDMETLSLLIIDIDFFKVFNDNFGHQVGDQVLRLVAQTLLEGIKGRDLSARFGGEEFVVLLPNTPVSAANKVAENLRHTIEKKELIDKTRNTNLGGITISIGVAEYINDETTTDFIDRADAALYQAKDAGRNQVKTAE